MLIVYDEIYARHLAGIPHPERPDRVTHAYALVKDRGVGDFLPARDATTEEIERAHQPGYVETVRREVASLKRHAAYLSTGDTVVDESSMNVALRAAGGAIVAAEMAYEQRRPVFALVRPPGHHAESRRGMGFCVFNNAAIAARAVQALAGARSLIVDFDYHHGNGTQDLSGSGLSYVSTHGYPAYPGTGGPDETYELGTASDAVINIPLPPHGFGTEPFVALWDELLERAARKVQPDMLIVSAGFDYVSGDPVGDLGVDVSAAAGLSAAISRVANTYCNGRVAYVLEGGYDTAAIAESVVQIAQVCDSREWQAASDASPLAIPAAQRRLLERSILTA